jgi:hypothetical protein
VALVENGTSSTSYIDPTATPKRGNARSNRPSQILLKRSAARVFQVDTVNALDKQLACGAFIIRLLNIS